MAYILNFELDSVSGQRKCALISKEKYTDQNRFKNLIIFSHGTGNDRFYPHKTLFETIVQNTDSIILTYDLDGHGRNSSTILDPKRILNFLPQLLKNLPFQLKKKCAKIILLGHSLGAVLSIQAAVDVSELPAAVIAISPPWKLHLKSIPVVAEFFHSLKKHVLKQVLHYGPYGILPSFGRFKRKSYPIRINSPGPSHYYYVSTIKMTLSLVRDSLQTKKISIPLKIISGALDSIAISSDLPHFKDCFTDSEIILLKKENHLSTLFACETKIVDIINGL